VAEGPSLSVLPRAQAQARPSPEPAGGVIRDTETGLGSVDAPSPVPFDNETLGGYVDYYAIIEPTRYLKGELEGLVIRYETPLPPLPTLAGQADA
jgi:hypothetical protein